MPNCLPVRRFRRPRTAFRSRWGTVLSVLLVFATVACSFVPSPLTPTSFRAASFVPGSTWLFTSVSFRPSLPQAMNAQRLVDQFTSQDAFASAWEEATGGGLDMPDGLDFERDVLPLLEGEVALAVFGELTPATEPLILVLVETSQPDALLTLLSEGLPPTPLPGYRGATFLQVGFDTYLAIVDGWLLAAPSRGILEAAVDLFEAQGRGGLADQPRYQSVAARLAVDRISYAYVDTTPVADFLLGVSDLRMPGFQDVLGESSGTVGMTFAATPGGLLVQAESVPDVPPALPPAATDSNTVTAFERLPATSLFAATGNGLTAIIAEAEEGLRVALESGALASPQRPAVPGEPPRPMDLELDGALDIDLDFEDLLAELSVERDYAREYRGDYALGIGPGSVRVIGGEPTGVPDITFAGRVTSPAATAAEVREWQALFPPKTVQTLGVSGGTVFQVLPEPGVSLAWGVVSDWLYLLTGDPLAALNAPAQGGLTRNPRFSLVRDTFVADGSNVFVDLEGARVFAEGLMTGTFERAKYERSVRPWVMPLRALATSTRTDADGSSSMRLYVAIGDE